MTCERHSLSALEIEDWIVLVGLTDEGIRLDETQCRRLLELHGVTGTAFAIPGPIADALNAAQTDRQRELLEGASSRNGNWFDLEMDKLDRWAEDRRASLKAELDELDQALREARKTARSAPTLPEKLERQRESRALESKRDEAWRAFDHASREVDRQKDRVLDEISHRLEQNTRSGISFRPAVAVDMMKA